MRDPKLEERKTNFKKANHGLLEAREKFKLTLRKQKIDEIIFERRDMSNSTIFQNQIERKNYEIEPESLKIQPEIIQKQFNSIEDLILFAKNLIIENSENLDCIKFGVYLLRITISKTKNIPFDFLINQGLCKIFSDLLEKYISDLSLTYEILWSFTNISCYENSSALKFFVEDRYTNNYIKIFEIFDKDVAILEQLIWHLGNILDSKDMVVEIIQRNIFDKIYNILERQHINEKIVKISTWFITNMLKFQIFEYTAIFEKCVEILLLFIKTEDEEIINDCLWGLSYASETDNINLVDFLIKERLCEYLYNLSIISRENIILPIIRITGNLSSNEDAKVDKLIDQGCIKFLGKNVFHKNNQIRKESLWAISNIIGNDSQINKIFTANLIPNIFYSVRDPDYEVMTEAIWVIGNLINTSNLENCVKLIDANVLDPILYLLSNYMDSYTLILTLNTIEKLLEHGKYARHVHEYNPFVKLFVEKGGLESIEKLQSHKNEKIYALVSNLIDNYFSDFIKNMETND